MSSKFRYTPKQNNSQDSAPPPQPSSSSSGAQQQNNNINNNNNNNNPAIHLILPDAAKNATVDKNIFGSFAGPIPTESSQNNGKFDYTPNNSNNSQNASNNANNNSQNADKPKLRLILGNRVNVPPTNK